MKLLFRILIFTCLTAAVVSCKRNPLKVDISDIKNNIEFVRFGKELFSLPLNDTLAEMKTLHEKYPGFFDLFTYRIIRIGGIDEENFTRYMAEFLTDTMVQNVKLEVEDEFSDFGKTEKEINKAFKYYQYHFPQKELPTVYTYISGYNQSVVTAENIVGISLDKYLGRDYKYYQLLSTTPAYKIKNMYPAKIPADVAFAWGLTEFPPKSEITNLLGNMVYQGKLMYFTDALLPETPDTVKIGYTKKELKWCENNEAEMWTYLVENKMLYSNKRMDIVRYINDGPTTSGFPVESPGRTGIWLGWQIVRKYMEEFPEITLPALMANEDYQGILNASGYFPE